MRQKTLSPFSYFPCFLCIPFSFFSSFTLFSSSTVPLFPLFPSSLSPPYSTCLLFPLFSFSPFTCFTFLCVPPFSSSPFPITIWPNLISLPALRSSPPSQINKEFEFSARSVQFSFGLFWHTVFYFFCSYKGLPTLINIQVVAFPQEPGGKQVQGSDQGGMGTSGDHWRTPSLGTESAKRAPSDLVSQCQPSLVVPESQE